MICKNNILGAFQITQKQNYQKLPPNNRFIKVKLIHKHIQISFKDPKHQENRSSLPTSNFWNLMIKVNYHKTR